MKHFLFLLFLALSMPNLVNAQEPNYLTFTSNQDVSTIGFANIADGATIKYNDGTGWKDASTSSSITLTNIGDQVQFCGDYGNVANLSERNYTNFIITGNVSVSGDINTLIDGKGGDIELKKFQFNRLFENCIALTDASGLKLPSTTLAIFCYDSMFKDCFNLTQAPALPAKNLAADCYEEMFSNCSSLTTAPELPAITMAERCYKKMFTSCSKLETAPALPAKTLDNYCYEEMFSYCSSLTTAPELPATTLADGCYYNMFFGCKNLTTAPELPATTLAESCYKNMFSGCSKLNEITVNFTEWNDDKSTYNWVKNVATTGTFICPSGLEEKYGDSNIPNGWTIKQPIPVEYYSKTTKIGSEEFGVYDDYTMSNLQSTDFDYYQPEVYTDADCKNVLSNTAQLGDYVENNVIKLYKKPIEYTITFDTKGNNTINPITYTIESETIDLSSYKGEKEGYHFVKWVDNENTEVTQIVKGSFGNVELTALFEAHSFTKYIYNNDATTETDGTETAECDYEGCNAIDVRIAEGTKQPCSINDVPTESVVIYAHHNTIVVENAVEDIFIYDTNGRCVANRDAASHVSITMQREGIYIVKCGNTVKRVLVM